MDCSQGTRSQINAESDTRRFREFTSHVDGCKDASIHYGTGHSMASSEHKAQVCLNLLELPGYCKAFCCLSV